MSDRILLIIGIFFLVLLLTQIFTAPLTSPAAQSRRLLRRRIAQLSAKAVTFEQISLVRHNYLQRLTPFERWLESWPIFTNLVRLIEQAGLLIPAYRIALMCLAGFFGALILTPLITEHQVLIAAIPVLAGLWPWIWLRYKKAENLRKFEEQLPEGLSMLARTLRAGLPLSQALQVVSQEMSGPVAKEFGIVFNELNYGGDLRSAFLAMLERIPSVSVMAMAVAIMIQRETGGNLAESVDRLEGLLRERFKFQRHVRTLTASNRTSAWIVGLIPFILTAVLELMSPGYLATLTDHPIGVIFFYGAVVMQAIGVIIILHMIKLDV